MVRAHGHLDSEETNQAAWVATRGAVAGAARWGIYSGILGAAAYLGSPLYRGLTIQFKVFLQMSGMALGSMIEADRRLRSHEVLVRARKRVARDAEIWKRYEQEHDYHRQRTPSGADGVGQGRSRNGMDAATTAAADADSVRSRGEPDER